MGLNRHWLMDKGIGYKNKEWAHSRTTSSWPIKKNDYEHQLEIPNLS